LGNKRSAPQCSLFHHEEEEGHQNQDVDSGSNHAANYGRSNRLHNAKPMPDSQGIGTRLASTAHTVISFGRKR
jgi:hypothetical protein